MARIDVTQDIVLTRVIERLRDQLELDARHCFETDDPDAVQTPRSGDYWVTVYIGPGQFDVPNQIGGGAEQLTETIPVIVTAYSRVRLDPVDEGEKTFHSATRGLYVLKAKLLKALVGHDLTDSDGNTFLRQLLYATRAAVPIVDKAEGRGKIAVEFGVEWDWDLDS